MSRSKITNSDNQQENKEGPDPGSGPHYYMSVLSGNVLLSEAPA
jgi:hypothetical protein